MKHSSTSIQGKGDDLFGEQLRSKDCTMPTVEFGIIPIMEFNPKIEFH